MLSFCEQISGYAPRCLVLVLAPLFGACELFVDSSAFEPEYVVESYQIAGEPLEPIRLSRTAPVEETYDFNALAVRGADVRVELLTASGDVEAVYPFREHPNRPGVYLPTDVQATLLPLRTYQMEAKIPRADVRVRVQTVVPDTFSIRRTGADTVVYQGGELLELALSRSSYPGRQNIYVFTAEALGALSEVRLVPIAREIRGGDESLEDLRIRSSPVLNEGNYDVDPSGTITIEVPWLIFAYYGDHRLFASALDDNLFDFLRTQTIQQNGAFGLSPGEVPNVVEHVEGGTGFFGSLARVAYEVHVERASEEAGAAE